MGCTIAYQLARAGLNVTLIERDAIAAHASGRNAGCLNPLYGTPPALIPFALEAFRLHKEVRSELVQLGCANYEPLPVQRIHLANDESDRQRLEEIATLYNTSEGFSSKWLERDDLRRIETRLGPDMAFGLLTEGSLSVDGHDFTSSLADAAVQLGVKVLHTAALGVVTSGDNVTGIKATEGVLYCDEVVLATGPWIADTKSWLGINLEVEPVKGEILLMRLEGAPTRYDFTWGPTSLYRRGADQVWVGVTVENCGFDSTPTAEAKHSLLERASHIMPSITRATLLDHVAALRPVTPSAAPIAARADGWQNVYIANGGGSKGILFSVGIASRICDLLLKSRSASPKETAVI